jgi:hypothetical protein
LRAREPIRVEDQAEFFIFALAQQGRKSVAARRPSELFQDPPQSFASRHQSKSAKHRIVRKDRRCRAQAPLYPKSTSLA